MLHCSPDNKEVTQQYKREDGRDCLYYSQTDPDGLCHRYQRKHDITLFYWCRHITRREVRNPNAVHCLYDDFVKSAFNVCKYDNIPMVLASLVKPPRFRVYQEVYNCGFFETE